MTTEKAHIIYALESKIKRISEFLNTLNKSSCNWSDIQVINHSLFSSGDDLFQEVKSKYIYILTSLLDKLQKEFDSL